ncbi:MAG: peptidoglycan-associated lipoprotein [SAR324 cluster bacterium]|uniref:Peptidoglycan-associated lipoprotein n=1 Tax=SAR324 cluster bacterium TaxID=2024889 RepID=A0A432GQ41_9DELT|nr:MAG: peptidoglycan-associated lipoprotein [SAR324 cluster bacterium]
MLKYFSILFTLLTLVLAGCTFSDPEEVQAQMDQEHARITEEQERQQEEEAEELLAQEAAAAEETAAKEAEAARLAAVDKETALDKIEKLLKPASIEVIQPEEPKSEPSIIYAISSGLKNLLGSSDKEQQEEPKKVADNVSASEKKSTTKFMPKSPLAIFSAQKLVSCKIVPEKMEDIHKRLLKIKDVNIADSKLRDKTNDKLMPVIHFDFDQIKIKPAYRKLLRQQSSCVMKALKSRNDMIIQIEGHADERGSDEYNMALGHRRANVVANAIKAYLPDSSLARIFSFGEEFPLVRLSNKNAWAKNRRVEFTLLLKP